MPSVNLNAEEVLAAREKIVAALVVILLPFKASAVAEKLYSSAPAICRLMVLPVIALMFKSPVLSLKIELTVPAGGEASSLVKVRESLVVSSTSPEKPPQPQAPNVGAPPAFDFKHSPAPPTAV